MYVSADDFTQGILAILDTTQCPTVPAASRHNFAWVHSEAAAHSAPKSGRSAIWGGHTVYING